MGHEFVISQKMSLVNYQNEIFLLTCLERNDTLVGAAGSQKEIFGSAESINSYTTMKKNLFIAMLVLGALTTGSMMSSCSMVNQAISSVRSIDMSQYPGLDIVANAQKGMMEHYAQSTKLLLQSRLSAVDALILDAEAIAANQKAGDVYESAKRIAANGKDKQKLLLAQIENITNAQDLDAIDKVKEATAGIDSMIAEGYNELSKATSSTNAQIAATNKKGDMYIEQAMTHLAEASSKITESHSLLQDAQIMEVKLVADAAMQSASLIKALEGASALDKGMMAVQFRPIIYFLTGLPDEFDEQENVKAMWEEHAAKSAINLNKKVVGDIKAVSAKAASSLKSVVSLDSFGISF